MRIPIYKIGGMRFFLVFLLSAASLAMSLTSCVSDNDANSKSISDYTDANVRSYGDLFEIFWKVMNQRYCDLNEQAGVSSLSWEQVYEMYKPKFEALKTFKPSSENTQAEILADNAKAKQYFQEIMNQIIDQHFFVKITLPVSHSSTETVRFESKLYEREPIFPMAYHWDYTRSQLKDDGTAFGCLTDNFSMMGGFVKDAPGVFYLGFSNFYISENCVYTYHSDYLPTNAENKYHIDEQLIATKASELVTDPNQIDQVKEEANLLLAQTNQFLASDQVQATIAKMEAYNADKNYQGLYHLSCAAYQSAPSFIQSLPASADNTEAVSILKDYLTQNSKYPALAEEKAFSNWMAQRLADYLWHEREFTNFWEDLKFTTGHELVETYRSKFLEPLAKGDIKKLILDVRSNGGGAVADTRLLTDFLVTQPAVYAYVRKKEDNNPYSYTPWIPQRIAVTGSSLKREIPTAILLDNHSASMSEITSLILKSQGNHVKLIGRNSCGAQSMLMDNSASNGGWKGNVTSYLYFYMPTCMTKDAQGRLLEGVGITPDYLLDPMTENEIKEIYQNAAEATDRAFQKALEVLR